MLRAIIILSLFFVFAAASEVRTEILNVDNANLLRTALAAAQDGDEVVLAPGVYPGRFEASQLAGVTIQSADPNDMAVINAAGEGIKLVSASRVTISDLIIQGAGSNGLNIDDGGFVKPSSDITLRNITVRNGGGHGIKLTGVDNFLIDQVVVTEWGNGHAGINLLGAHDGVVVNSSFRHSANSAFGIKVEAGSSNVAIRANRFVSAGERAIQFGGGVPESVHRPTPTGDAKVTATDIVAEGNVIVERGNVGAIKSAVAFIGTDGGIFRNNMVFRPSRFIAQVLKENRTPGFVDTQNGLLKDNVFVWNQGDLFRPPINIGSNTVIDSFNFEGNLWYNQTNPANSVLLPFEDDEIYGVEPEKDVNQPITWDFDWGLWLVNATEQDFNVVIEDDLFLATPSEDAQLDLGLANPLVGDWTITPVDSNVRPIDAFSNQVYLRGLLGDFDQSGAYDEADINLLFANLQSVEPDLAFDLNGDELVDVGDRDMWVNELARTYFGDSDLNFEFNSSDLLVVFQAGEYEDGVPGNSVWRTGDWDGDADFGSSDIVLAFQAGGYEKGPRTAKAQPVPEPSAISLALLCATILFAKRRRGW